MFTGFTCLQVLQKLQVLQEVQFKNILCFITTIKIITGFTRIIKIRGFTRVKVQKYFMFYYKKLHMLTGFTCFTCLQVLQKLQVVQEVQFKTILCFITTIK